MMNQLSSWNPQLVRELRGRLKTRNILAAIALSTIAQVLLCLVYWQSNWSQSPQEQWSGVWTTLTWTLPYLLFVLGGYYIVGDITQEEKRGTLNFIRLSPRPGWQILFGKMLGVPILPLLTLATLIPLHLWTTIAGGKSLVFMVSYYLLLGAGLLLCYSLALLYGLTSSGQVSFMGQQGSAAISYGAIAFFVLSPLFMLWNSAVTWQGFDNIGNLSQAFDQGDWLYWSFIPISSSFALSHLFTLINIAICVGLLWRMLLRRFRQPRSTLMSKRQSYALLAYAEILMVGFTLNPTTRSDAWEPTGASFALYLISAILLLMLMFAIVPQRQALLDWSRYPARGLQSWVWADKSPMLLAMLIHIAMVWILLFSWTFLVGLGWQHFLVTFIAFIGVTNALVMYGLVIQTIMAGRTRNPWVWTIGILSIWLIVPPMLLGLLGLTPNQIPASAVLWTILGYPFLAGDEPRSHLFDGVGLIIQWTIMGGLWWQCDRTLKQLRRSLA